MLPLDPGRSLLNPTPTPTPMDLPPTTISHAAFAEIQIALITLESLYRNHGQHYAFRGKLAEAILDMRNMLRVFGVSDAPLVRTR